jgi:hypothetical protein
MFETALKADAKRRMRQIGRADIVVGIPCYRNAKTIAGVVEAAATGLAAYYPDLRAVLVVADGGSTDESPELASAPFMPDSVRRIVTGYHGMMGKGSAVRAVFQIVHALEARACLILDGDLRNMPPDWIRALADPILSSQYEYATPHYTRPRTESCANDLLAYPLARTLLGRDVRQPAGNEFALSGELAAHFADKDVWETDVARGGLGVWMTAIAIHEGRRMCQIPLGTRRYESREPTSAADQAFSHMMGTLFRMAYILRKIWLAFPAIQPVPFSGDTPLQEPDESVLTEAHLIEKFRQPSKRQRRMWNVALSPELLEQVKDVFAQPDDAFRFSDDLWARCVCDFIVVYNKGETDPDRIVEALIPVCAARQLALLKETAGMSVDETERVIARQAEAFIAARPYLLERWRAYVAWTAPTAANAQ